MALEIGSRIAHYDVTALIGDGGMGRVYQATDTKLNRQLAATIARRLVQSIVTATCKAGGRAAQNPEGRTS